MTDGVVVGGWGFVWGAYALTFIAFALYAAMLLVKVRSERKRAGESGDPR